MVCEKCVNDWNLKLDVPKFTLTDSEIEILKSIKVLYPNVDKTIYNWDTDMFTEPTTDELLNILASRLPSLSKDVIYSIDELLKGE